MSLDEDTLKDFVRRMAAYTLSTAWLDYPHLTDGALSLLRELAARSQTPTVPDIHAIERERDDAISRAEIAETKLRRLVELGGPCGYQMQAEEERQRADAAEEAERRWRNRHDRVVKMAIEREQALQRIMLHGWENTGHPMTAHCRGCGGWAPKGSAHYQAIEHRDLDCIVATAANALAVAYDNLDNHKEKP